MTRKQAIAILGIILLLGAGSALIYAWHIKNQQLLEAEQVRKAYVSEEAGFSFTHAPEYLVSETELGSQHRITLIHEAEQSVPANSEGPTSITIDIYPNEVGRETAEEWVRASSDLFNNLGTSSLIETEVDGVPAVRFTWDGLYRGESVAVVYRGSVIVFSATSISPEDAILSEFAALLDSVQLPEEGEPAAGNPLSPGTEGIACTMDARLCPDGSYVGRIGPKCEFAACPTAETSATVRVPLGGVSEGLGVRIVPLEVIEDSRCPSDVQCIQAGTVRVRTQVGSQASMTAVDFTLNVPQAAQGKKVTLIKVEPERFSTGQISSSNYVFTFSIANP